MHIKNRLLREVLTLRQSSQTKGVQNPKKKIYTGRPRERFKSHSDSTASTTSSITNNHCLIRDHLESNLLFNYCQGLRTQSYSNQQQASGSYPATTASSVFTNTSNIPDITPAPIKAPGTGYSLWRRHCHYICIKNSTSAARSLCKYTKKVVLCMVLTGEGRFGLDI